MANQPGNDQQLAGRRILIATPGCPHLQPLAASLNQRGATCLQLGNEHEFTDQHSIASAFGRAGRELGTIDAVVLAVGNHLSRRSSPWVCQSPDHWQAACLTPLRTTRHCLQAIWKVLAGRPCSVVMLGPNLSLTGAPGLVALSVLSEGQRALMKSAARQWGAQGVRLNWLGLAAAVYAPELAETKLPASPELGPPPPALGFVPELQNGVADNVSMLITSTAVTGASVTVDGGLWMVP